MTYAVTAIGSSTLPVGMTVSELPSLMCTYLPLSCCMYQAPLGPSQLLQ